MDTINTPSPTRDATQHSSVAESGGKMKAGGPPLPPPYGDEPPDYERYRYGYPRCSGRMFGSGN